MDRKSKIPLIMMLIFLVSCVVQFPKSHWIEVFRVKNQNSLIIDQSSSMLIVTGYGEQNIFLVSPREPAEISKTTFKGRVDKLCVFGGLLWIVDISGKLFYNNGLDWYLIPEWDYGLANGCVADDGSRTLMFWSKVLAISYEDGVWKKILLPTSGGIIDLKIDSSGNVYLLSDNGELFKKDKHNKDDWALITRNTPPDAIKLLITQDDGIWIATADQLYTLGNDTAFISTHRFSKRNVTPVVQNVIFVDGVYWIFLPEQIYLYDKSNSKDVDLPTNSNYIYDAQLDGDDIYLLTDEGIYVYTR